MRLQYLAASILASFLAGVLVEGWRLGREHAEYVAEQRQILADTMASARSRELSLQQRLTVLDRHYTEEISHAQTVNDQLRTDIERGRVRLSVPAARCGGVSEDTGTAGKPDAAERAELDPAAAKRIVRVAQDGDSAIRQLTALQQYVMAVCMTEGSR